MEASRFLQESLAEKGITEEQLQDMPSSIAATFGKCRKAPPRVGPYP